MWNGDVTDVELDRCRGTESKVREVLTARITAGYVALSEVSLLIVSYGGTQRRKKASASETIMMEIPHTANG